MPATSKVQQGAAGAALAAKRGEKSPSELYGASKGMYKNMSAEQLGHFAGTKRKGLPHSKSLLGMNNQGMTSSGGYPAPKACMKMEDAAKLIVNRVLAEDGDETSNSPEEAREVSLGRTILSALERLQSTLGNADEAQQRDLTTIRASATTLIRMHQKSEGPLGRTFFQGLNPSA